MELLRSLRLVVDTGIHYYEWDYDKTFKYLKDNGFETDEQIDNQIIRYTSIPGQALCYKMGEKCIIECLNKFLKNSKDKDIRLFHKLVLENGAIPLHLLRQKF